MPNNIWRWTAKDKDGKPVEAAPGLKTFASRGPQSESVMRVEAQRILNARLQLEWYAAGQPENWQSPGYVVDKIEPAGHSDQTEEPIGAWRPPASAPITLPQPEIPGENA